LARRIHHVQLAIPPGEEPRAEGFYAGLLGLRSVEKPLQLRHLGGLWFECTEDGVQLHLGVEEPFRPAKKAHVAIVVEDLLRAEQSLAAAGHPIVVDTQLEGYRPYYTEDPFGNRMEILAEEPGLGTT